MARSFGASGGWQLTGVAIVASCLLSGCGDSGTPGMTGNAGGDGGGGSSAGGAGKAGVAGEAGKAGAPMQLPADCSRPAPAKDGAVLSAITPQPSNYTTDVAAACDGSFVVTGGAPRGVSFARADGTQLELADATLWVARFDADSELIWADAIHGGESIAVRLWAYAAPFSDGSVSVGGVFGTSATFAVGQANETTLTTSSAELNGFVAHYSATGALDWVQQVGPNGDVYVVGVAPGVDGSTYVAIHANKTKGLTLGSVSLEGGDWAIAKLDADGKWVAVSVGTALQPDPIKLVAADDGGVVVAASLLSNAVVGKGSAEEVAFQEAGLVLAHLSDELRLDWVRPVVLPTNVFGTAVLPDGSAVFTGRFYETLTLGQGEPNAVTFTKHKQGVDTDGFVARLDPDGQLAWAIQLASAANTHAYGAAGMPDGSVWIAGGFGAAPNTPSSVVLAPDTPAALSLSSEGTTSFVARLGAEGAPQWATSFEGDGSLYTQALAPSPGSLIAVGDFEITTRFGSSAHELTPVTRPSTFIVRLGP